MSVAEHIQDPILEVDAVTMRFGGLVANDCVSFQVKRGEVFALIGPNGAGKSTLFNAITGVHQATEGRVRFEGKEIRRDWSATIFTRMMLNGIVLAFFVTLALRATTLWKDVIVTNYIYDEPFPIAQALRSFGPSLTSIGFWGVALPALIGFVVGAGGYVTLWSRARRTPDLIARSGMGRTFQNIRLFGELSVIENVLVGMHAKLHCGFLTNMLRLPRFFRENVVAYQKAYELLRFVGLEARAGEAARNLPYGLQRRLEIARALAGEPRILLLDEPAAGMNPTETGTLMELIRRIRDSGVTVLLIEHHMRVVMGVSDRICVLNFGKQIAQGTPEHIRNDPACIEAYLGKEELG
jgi:ABC-type branched-subunit amino acid transport system ATPase component